MADGTDGTDAASRRREPSMTDVARAAGVSGQTVSRVVNGRTNVDPATRDRVVDAMRRLGYRPNSAARALRSGRFRSIGVVMFAMSSFGNMKRLEAVATSAARAGYAVTLIPLDSVTPSSVSGAFHRLGEHAVDGVVVLIEGQAAGMPELDVPPGLPVVVVDSAADPTHPVVDTDQAQGATLATEHLLDLGHDTVWHVAGPAGSHSAAGRRDAWRAALERRGRPVPEPLVGDWSADSGHRLGRQLAADPSVTAVFAANDQMAMGVLRALHEAGRRVPEEVSVVGFDDMPESADLWPPLTTVRQHFDRVGERALAILVDAIEGRPATPPPLVATDLVVRGSTAAAS